MYRKSNKALLFWGIAAIFIFLSACGNKESRRGIDGYIYTAAELPLEGASRFKSRDGYLYYCDQNNADSLYRIPMEQLLSVRESDSIKKEPVAVGDSGSRILDYTLDETGAVYYYLAEMDLSASWQSEIKNGMLIKQSEDKKEIYRIPLELDLNAGYAQNTVSLAADGEGQVFLLAEDMVYVTGPEGNPAGTLNISEYQAAGNENASKRLAEGAEGRIYYILENAGRGELEVYEILKEKAGSETNFRLERLTAFRDELRTNGSYGTVFASFSGLLYNDNDGILKQYQPKDGDFRELLRWSDSSLTGNPAEIIWISEECLAAYFHMFEGTKLYLLTRKDAAEVPEKEELTLAITYPSPYLEQCVADFNWNNERYHIRLKTYAGEDLETRLDAELASSNPPDLLDLTYMDAGKYAGKGLLEDLAPYMESSSLLKLEEYWDGILEGYTVDGKLVCLPGSFGISVILGRDSLVGSLKNWDMEAIIALSEEYPKARLMENDSFQYVLEELLGDYILEQYIDWETGACTFDQGAFGELMLWLEAHTARRDLVSGEDDYEGGIVPENMLLLKADWNSWSDPVRYEMIYQEDMSVIGYPSRNSQTLYYGIPYDLMGIVSGSKHKEGAWEFLEYYLPLADAEENWGFPVRKDIFDQKLEEQATPEYLKDENGEIRIAWGNPVMKAKSGFTIDEELVEYYFLTPEQAELLRYTVEHTSFSLNGGIKTEILGIITEEMNHYFNREKTLEETTAIIQNRIQLLVQERM